MTQHNRGRVSRAWLGALALATERGGLVWACVTVLAVTTFANSFTHIHDLAEKHKQQGWFAWAIAVSVELLPITSWLIRQYRARSGMGRSQLPYIALGSGVLMSLGAQLAQAKPGNRLDVIFACWPAYVFALVMVMAETTLMQPMPEAASQSEATQDEGGGTTGPVEDDATKDSRDTDEKPRRRPTQKPRQGDRRIPRDQYIGKLVKRLTEDPRYQINYEAEAAATSYSRSWLEKAWGEAQRKVPKASPVKVAA